LKGQDLDDESVIRLETRFTGQRPFPRNVLPADARIGTRQGLGALLRAAGTARRAKGIRASRCPHPFEYRLLLIGWQILEDFDLLCSGRLRYGRGTLQATHEQPGHGKKDATRPHPNGTLHAYS
jgi:hypothetical protein